MSKLPEKTLVEKIDSGLVTSDHRPHIGYSQSGDPCARSIWYTFRWATAREISKRVMRIFGTGSIMEDFMIESLSVIGIKVYDEQKKVDGPHGHIGGSIDGICIGVPGDEEEEHLVEFKTMNERNFKDLVKNKLKKSKPTYYAQVQCYMGKLKLGKCLFMAYNKNDSSYYIEIVEFDKDHYELLQAKLLDVLYSEFPPVRIGKKTWFECKFCNHYGTCQNGNMIDANCRTCELSSAEEDGKWMCSKIKSTLTIAEQRIGCKSWLIDEDLK